MHNAGSQEKFKNIRLLAMDFDGVMTDGRVLVLQDGMEGVVCSRKDGLGVEMLQKAGIKVAVISKETNNVVGARCKKLSIPCWQAIATGEGKKEILERIAKEHALERAHIAYIGDDVNDIPALEYAGLAIVVGDGHTQAKEHADYITTAKGGDHAVREVCDLLLANL